eukprot:scaffold9884_cov111-Isochrysis_galbana.AAC.2
MVRLFAPPPDFSELAAGPPGVCGAIWLSNPSDAATGGSGAIGLGRSRLARMERRVVVSGTAVST